MQTLARDEYLVTEVMTATPQKLQLMLIDAAIRFGQQAQQHSRAGRDQEAGEAILRAQEIVSQLMGGLRPDHQPDLARQVAGVYLFIFRSLLDAHLNRSEKSLADALSVLKVEQETWRAVCAKLGTVQDEAPATGLRLDA
jgi:flagellar protein FliS